MIRQHIVDRVMARRGRLHLFDTIDARRSALVVIDMQKTFCEPGAPAEVASSRTIIEPINRLATALRNAQTQYLDDPKVDASLKHPYYWAPFTLVGEGGATGTNAQIPASTLSVAGL